MELERQIIARLQNKNHPEFTIYAIEKSKAAVKLAKENLAGIENLELIETDTTFEQTLEIIKTSKGRYRILFIRDDLLNLENFSPNKFFDLIYHSFFRHHLKNSQTLDNLSRKLSKNVYEYDGYRSSIHLLPQIIEGWKSPIFLNASVFSNLRYPTKKSLKEASYSEIDFFKIGTYLKTYNS